MGSLCRSLLVVAALVGALSFTASAQAQSTIKAVDSPGPAWQPDAVTVPSGTTVSWEFDQATNTHSITSTGGSWSVDETRNANGAAVTHKFTAPGTYTFHCKFHGAMTGTVTVTDEPRFDVLVFSRTTGFRHTDAIDAGKLAIPQMGEDGNYNVELTEDPTRFTDAGLRPYEVIVFLNDDGEGILNAAQRTAFERWTQRGGGIVGIHATANADRNWAWKGDMMGGSWFNNHPDGALQFQNATVNRVDDTHPATIDVPENWVREDEWYNFTAEPQGVHVLLKLDESTYVEQDGSDGVDDDHPIAWCSNYDGGRHFYTALGHKGSYWSEPAYLAHIRGAIEWASGEAPGDCGPQRDGLPTDASFDKVTLDDTTENPMEIAVDAGGNVFYVELAGKVKHYNATTKAVRTIATIPVHRGNENGLLGITLDPNFAVNHWLYLFYSAPSPEEQHISRFTVAADGTLDMSSEKVLLRFPHQRIICCHSSGSLTFGPDGNLYISTGDDTQHAESQGYNPIDDRLANEPGDNPDADHARDARRSAGNTNDLRGKILRIHPEPDGTYTIPAGNLFGLAGKYPAVEGKTRPEIYTMGHRNPFRIQVDSETGWLYNGEVGPDAGGENANRGPRGYDELNQIRGAGNMGWPYCIADNKAYSNWDFGTQTQSGFFDCDGGGGVDEGPLTRRGTPARRTRRRRPARCCGGRTSRTRMRRTSPGTRPRRRSRRVPAVRPSRGRSTTSTPPAAAPRSSRSGSTTRSSSPTGRATGSRRSSSISRASRRRSRSSCRTPTSGIRRTSRWAPTARSTCSSGAATSTTPARASTRTPACTGSTTRRAPARRSPGRRRTRTPVPPR
jgi:glucose/arabinose dehydrogenase/plastocyanin